MGNGIFVNGRLNFTVSANMLLTAVDRQKWKDFFTVASDALYRATGTQVSFGTIYLTDEGGANRAAEVLLSNIASVATASLGNYGKIGSSVTLPLSRITNPLVLVHEFGHHVWNLGEEYAGTMEAHLVDLSTPYPNTVTVRLQAPLVRPPLAGDQVLVWVAGTLERREITSVAGRTITVSTPFSQIPSRNDNSYMWLQRTIGMQCGVPIVPRAMHCLMSANYAPTSDFCEPHNHDTSILTDQQQKHQKSCWETIVARPGFTHLTIQSGFPAVSSPTINFVDLVKQNRIVLAIDRSGSMRGDQLAYAKEAAKYWIDFCTLANDSLSVIAYNSTPDVVLPLTPMSPAPNPAQLDTAIDAVTALGETNIRDALLEGVAQINSVAGRAQIQAIVLLTDGKHNYPAGSSLTEAITDLRANGIFVFVVAIGDDNSIDIADLDQLVLETNGTRAIVDPLDPVDTEAVLIEANAQLRGEALTVQLEDFAAAPPNDPQQKRLDAVYKRSARPRLQTLLAAIGISSLPPTARQQAAGKSRMRIHKFIVERGCEVLSASIVHAFDADIEIYLVSPAGQEIQVRSGNSAGGKTYALQRIENPQAGTWRCYIIARHLPKRPITTRLIIGAENRKLQVIGGVSALNWASGGSVNVHAYPRWGWPLTGLTVTAEILHGPTKASIVLADGGLLSETAGDYAGTFTNLKPGHYRGVIRVIATTKTLRADLRHVVTHSSAEQFETKSRAPAFRREIPIHFHVN